MTPKEKAKELFDKMYLVDDIMGNYPMCFDTAKKCALIAVDEIIKELEFAYNGEVIIGHTHRLYWSQVKQEILEL